MKASQGPALVSISGRRMRSSCSLEPRCGRVPLQSQTQSRLNPAQGSWEGCAGEMDKREMQPAGVPSGGEGRSVADLDGGLATNGHRTAVRERSPVQDLFRPGQVGSRSGYWLYALTLSCINRGGIAHARGIEEGRRRSCSQQGEACSPIPLPNTLALWCSSCRSEHP
jgi:hypothetical protein